MKRFLLSLCLITALTATYAQVNDSVPAITSVRDTLITGDSILVIHTVCAPICSSVVLVYSKENEADCHTMTPPISTPFPEAYIENGQLLWRDNESLLLDDEEKKHK